MPETSPPPLQALPLHELAARLPFELAQEFGIVPVFDEGGAIHVATAPHHSLDALGAARQRLGKPLRTQPVAPERFRELLTQAYSASAADAASAATTTSEAPPLLDETDLLAQHGSGEDAPAIRIVAELLREALAQRASDIHLDASAQGGRVRFRIDGVLRDVRTLDAATHAALVARCKVMATLDIAERRLPQDGRLQVRIAGHTVDVRVATLPTQHGERVVLRLLDTSAARLDLAALGLAPDTLAAFRAAVRKPHGLVLVTGPTGSGKTTSLYAAVSELDRERLNVVSVEDPVEYALDRVAQTQVNARIELSFARALRSILRHDPAVIIIGEIRDRETAEIAIQASLTGHLVLASLHTNTAGAAITRLADMGIEPYLLASSLRGVLAQRLVRRLHPAQRTPHPTTAAEAELLRAHGLPPLPTLHDVAPEADPGYSGRIGLYRWLPITPEIARAIHERAADTTLEALAEAAGWPPLAADAGRHLAAGSTSLAEVLRAVAA